MKGLNGGVDRRIPGPIKGSPKFGATRCISDRQVSRVALIGSGNSKGIAVVDGVRRVWCWKMVGVGRESARDWFMIVSRPDVNRYCLIHESAHCYQSRITVALNLSSDQSPAH